MYKQHDHILTPSNDLAIWRYLDLWKFLDIIDNHKLYMCRCDVFEDKFEGKMPIRGVNDLDSSDPLKQVNDFAERELKKRTYISSWSSQQDETYPLWKIYSDYRQSVAIKSTVGDLIKSIKKDNLQQYIGKVKYVDPKSLYILRGNTYQLFFEKRKYFSFEEEVRMLTDYEIENDEQLLKLPLGVKIDINPKKLIQKIFLAPLADLSFKKLIELKLKDSGLDIEVLFSDI